MLLGYELRVGMGGEPYTLQLGSGLCRQWAVNGRAGTEDRKLVMGNGSKWGALALKENDAWKGTPWEGSGDSSLHMQDAETFVPPSACLNHMKWEKTQSKIMSLWLWPCGKTVLGWESGTVSSWWPGQRGAGTRHSS